MFLPDYFFKNVFCVDLNFLKKNNIEAVIFDVDNTLVGFTVEKPTQEIKEYIKTLLDNGIKVAVASNNNENRVSVFCEDLNVPYIYRACKPCTISLRKLCKIMGTKPKKTALVGDQIYTDMWGANLCGMTSVLVDIIDTKENLTFKFKRALERPIVRAKIRKDEKKNG